LFLIINGTNHSFKARRKIPQIENMLARSTQNCNINRIRTNLLNSSDKHAQSTVPLRIYPLSSHTLQAIRVFVRLSQCKKGKAVPLQAWTGPEGTGKSMFPDFVTTVQHGGSLSALRTGRLYPQEILLVLISVRG